jgi:hypothetical protein
MGAKIPWDACSYCCDWDAVNRARNTFDPARHKHWGMAVLEEHKKKAIRGIAVTSADYCVHLRSQKNRVLEDGRKVFMWNIFPRFFDISCVFIGADRTARVMWHLGSSFRDDGPIPQPLRVAQQGLQALFSKMASKHAELDKEIPGVVEKVLSESDSAPEVRFDLMNKDPQKVLSSAAALGMLLSPSEFHRLLGGQGAFSTATSKIDDSLAVRPQFLDSDLLSAMRFMVPERSAYQPFVAPRIISIQAKIVIAPSSKKEDNEKVAALYNGYRLSVLENAEKLASRASEYLIDDPLGEKRAIHPLAALLLGLAPVVHLVAAHLRQKKDEGQQLGTMANWIAEHPTFISLAALGAGIRTAMAAESGGLLPAALSLLGKAKV